MAQQSHHLVSGRGYRNRRRAVPGLNARKERELGKVMDGVGQIKDKQMIPDGSGMAKDLVCGMYVHPVSALHTVDHEGTVHYFCGPLCRKTFNANPAKFLDPGHRASKMSGLRAIVGGVFGRS